MSKKIYLIVSILFAVPGSIFTRDINRIAVDFDAVSHKGTYTVNLKLTNGSKGKLSLRHPDLQYGMAIIIMDELGNVLQPAGIAKVSPGSKSLLLEPGKENLITTSRQYLDLARKNELHFPFLSGSALFGYKLEKGNRYRVIVVFRPYGKEDQGVCSKEKIIQFN